MTARAIALTLVMLVATARADPPAPARSPRHALAVGLGATAGVLAIGAIGAAGMALSIHQHVRHPGVREWASVTMTTVGIGGIIFAPSVGRWYGERRFPETGVAIRGIAFGVTLLSVVFDGLRNLDCRRQTGCGPSSVAVALELTGAATIVGSTVYELATTSSHVARYNAEHGLEVVPALLRSPRSTGAPGLGLVARW